jgi:hypothetical protein
LPISIETEDIKRNAGTDTDWIQFESGLGVGKFSDAGRSAKQSLCQRGQSSQLP